MEGQPTVQTLTALRLLDEVHKMPKRPYPRHRRQHNAILVSILQNPLQTNKEIAKATGYSPSQVSRIVCSPEFLELYGILFQEVAYGARANWLDRLKVSG